MGRRSALLLAAGLLAPPLPVGAAAHVREVPVGRVNPSLLATREAPYARFLVEGHPPGAILALFPSTPPAPSSICEGEHTHFIWDDESQLYLSNVVRRAIGDAYSICTLTGRGWTLVEAISPRALNANTVPLVVLAVVLFIALSTIFHSVLGLIPLAALTAAATRFLMFADLCCSDREMVALLALLLGWAAALRRHPVACLAATPAVGALVSHAARAAGVADPLKTACFTQQCTAFLTEFLPLLLRLAAVPWVVQRAVEWLRPSTPAPLPLVAGLLVGGLDVAGLRGAACAVAVSVMLAAAAWRARPRTPPVPDPTDSPPAASTHAMRTRSRKAPPAPPPKYSPSAALSPPTSSFHRFFTARLGGFQPEDTPFTPPVERFSGVLRASTSPFRGVLANADSSISQPHTRVDRFPPATSPSPEGPPRPVGSRTSPDASDSDRATDVVSPERYAFRKRNWDVNYMSPKLRQSKRDSSSKPPPSPKAPAAPAAGTPKARARAKAAPKKRGSSDSPEESRPKRSRT